MGNSISSSELEENGTLIHLQNISEFQPVDGDVAQLEERCLRKAEVGGSIPLISTIISSKDFNIGRT